MQEIQVPPGVSRAATPSERQGRWFDSNLVRWRDGVLRPWGGWERITETPLTSAVLKIFAWRDNNDVRRAVIGTNDGLRLLEGGTVRNITPAGFISADDQGALPDGYGTGTYNDWDYGAPRQTGTVDFLRSPFVSLDNWGEDLLTVSSSDGRLYEWKKSFGSGPATIVANAPTPNRAMIVTPERHVMLIGYDGKPRDIAWSKREDYTSSDAWNFASLTSTAGFLPIATEGLLQSAAPVRDGTLVFSDVDVWLVSYVGEPFIYKADRVGAETSLLSSNTVASFAGMAAWMGRSGFFMYRGGGTVTPMPSDVSDYVYQNIDPVYGVLISHAGVNGIYPEIVWFWPSKGSQTCNKYVTWNYADNTWAVGSLDRSAWFPAGVFPSPMASGVDGHLYLHETGTTKAGVDFAPGEIYAETSMIALGSGSSAMDVFAAQLDSGSNYDATRIRISGRYAKDSGTIYQFTGIPRTDGWMDLRFAARDMQIRIENAGASTDWSIGKMRYDFRPSGQR